MQLIINGTVLKKDEVISFKSLPRLNIVCAALNSRPSVSIVFLNTANNLTLPIANKNMPNPYKYCDEQTICQTQLEIVLTPGFVFWNNINSITCFAENKLADISSSITYAIDTISNICSN